MKEYIPLLENIGGFNPYKFDIGTTEQDMEAQYPNVQEEYVEFIMRIVDKFDTPSEINDSFKPAISVYVKDYTDTPFIKFLKTYLSEEEPTVDKYEDLTDSGQEVYKLLQTQGEESFYEILGTHLNQKISNNEVIGQGLENAANDVNTNQKNQNKKQIVAQLKKNNR